MDANPLLDRFQRMSSTIQDMSLLDVTCDGDRLLLHTGDRLVQRTRLRVRVGGSLGMVAGLALVFFTLWGWAVLVLSLAVLLFGPRFVSSHLLLEIDTAGEQLILLPSTGVAVGAISLASIRSLQGVYETKGWDPYSTLYAQRMDGSQTPILLLMGCAEKMASDACHLLGELLDCPATYTGPFGEIETCYEPITQ